MSREHYQVFVSKDYFKFNAAHFMAYPGFRERLHGHNYRVSVRIEGQLGADGYVVDFGDIKKAAKRICEEMDERLIVPMKSDVLAIERADGQIRIATEDGARFSVPESDCVLLPIAHSSAEELATYVCGRLVREITVLASRKATSIEVTVAESPLQEARYRIEL
jgi:dihydroneopterin triphosphate aldolase (PTPS-III) / 6-pyruvoyltetrahydropterin synthase